MHAAKTRRATVLVFIMGLLILGFTGPKCFAAGQDGILGRWRDVSGSVEVEIYKKKDKYHGKIVWLKEPNYRDNDRKGMAGKPRVDRENPDPSMRTRPLIEMDLFWDCVYTENNRWENGMLYDPLKGRSYRCSITMDKPERLRVRGFTGVELLGKTIFFKRLPI